MCKVRVALSEAPAPPWRAVFHGAVHARPGVAGATVTIVDGEILFACAGADIDKALAELDAWVDEANGLAPSSHPPLLRPAHVRHRDLSWREQRAVDDAAGRADSLRDE